MQIRLTEAEYEAIERKFRNSGLKSRSEFIRAMIFEGYIVHFDEEKFDKIYKLIAAMTGETVITVERNMHDTLNAGWPNRDKELAKTIFSRFLQSEADVPCVTLYTSMIGEWILKDIP